MGLAKRLRSINPLRLLQTDFAYQRIPSWSATTVDSAFSPTDSKRWKRWDRSRLLSRMSLAKALRLALTTFVIVTLLVGVIVHSVRHEWWGRAEDNDHRFYWQEYEGLNGYYNGVRNLVPYKEYKPQNGYNLTLPLQVPWTGLEKMPRLEPVVYDPYPDYASTEYLRSHQPVRTCYLDEEETVALPDVFVYPGLPQHLPQPLYGSYSELGIRDDICFERFGRYGPYGYSYDDNLREHGLRTKANRKDDDLKKIVGQNSEKVGSEKVFEQAGYTNWTGMDWEAAQRQCFAKNKARF